MASKNLMAKSKTFPLSVFRLIAYLCEDMRGIVTILIAFATPVSCGGVRKKSATMQDVAPPQAPAPLAPNDACHE